MKNILLVLSTILLIGLFSFSPKKSSLLPTKLRITVLDGLGNTTTGATVTLYESEIDYRNSKNPADSGKTDEKGRITFKNLKPIEYYMDARKGDMTNNGEGVKISALQEGRLNLVNTVIE